jgi:nitrite reductase/ring-hydroxylating ferredoxin subunit
MDQMTTDQNTYLDACALGDLAESEPRRVVLDGTAIALVRIDDEVFAIFDKCSHADVALSEGDVEDHLIECFLHGSCFDLRTGRPTSLPANRPVPVYPVRIQGEGADARVLVAVGAPITVQEH